MIRKRTFIGTMAVVAIVFTALGYFLSPLIERVAFNRDYGIWFCHGHLGKIRVKNGDTIECSFGRSFDTEDYDTPETNNSSEGQCARDLAQQAETHLIGLLKQAKLAGKTVTVVAKSKDRSFRKFNGKIQINNVSVAEKMIAYRTPEGKQVACATRSSQRVKKWCVPNPCEKTNIK